MALAPCSDLSAADWIATSELVWSDLVVFGPSGFAAYSRLRFIPDPAFEGQRENDVALDWDAIPDVADQWRARLKLLAAHTSTPQECYFCLWDGWPDPPHSLLQMPKLKIPRSDGIPMRAYFLFRGPLPAAVDWVGDGAMQGGPQVWPAGVPGYEPAFVWPADHAWCVANDVDPHWAGIGGDAPLIERLVADPRLDAVAADPADDQPFYR